MGLFEKRKVKIIKENNNGKEEYILDCVKQKEPMNLGRKIIQEFMIDKSAWFIIDTNFSYEKDHKITEVNLKKILDLLDKKEIPYISRDKMAEKSVSLMGIPMKKIKVKEIKVGIEVSLEVLDILGKIFENSSFFCYMTREKSDFDEILKLHNHINVDGNEYQEAMGNDWFQVFIYMDNYFKRIRIVTEQKIEAEWMNRLVEKN